MLAVASPVRTDRLERMTNLVLVLLETNRPLTLREIAASVAGYPADRSAARQAFERDKRALRDLGIPLSVEQVETEDQLGYRIHPDEYYLPDLHLEEADEQALAFAIAAVQLGGGAGWDALAKLGGPVSEAAFGRAGLTSHGVAPEFAPVAVLPFPHWGRSMAPSGHGPSSASTTTAATGRWSPTDWPFAGRPGTSLAGI